MTFSVKVRNLIMVTFFMIYILCKSRKILKKDVSKILETIFIIGEILIPFPVNVKKVTVTTFHYFLSKLDRKMSANVVWSNDF